MTLPTFNPPYPPSSNEDQPEIKLLKAEFGDGYTQEGADGVNHIRSQFQLKWDVLTPAQADQLVAFFKERAGYKRFLYTPSDSSDPIKVVCDEWRRERGTPNTVSASFKERFDIGD
jgi:phage-related protein